MGCADGIMNTSDIDNNSDVLELQQQINSDEIKYTESFLQKLDQDEHYDKITRQLTSVILNTKLTTQLGSSNIFEEDSSKSKHSLLSNVTGEQISHQLPFVYIIDSNLKFQEQEVKHSKMLQIYENLLTDVIESEDIEPLVKKRVSLHPELLENIFQ